MFATEPRELPTERLEAEIARLYSHISAQMCRWLLLVGELERREAHLAWGARSAAHWLSWHCGIGLRAAYEHVRVGRALAERPLIRSAYARGELSYCKVRALTRIANPHNEADLLELARNASGAQLERVAGNYRRALTPEDLDEPHARRELTHHADRLFELRARLAPEEGELVRRAIEHAAERLRRERTEEALEAERGRRELPIHPAGELRAEALVRMAEVYLAAAATADSTGGDRNQVVVHVDAEALASPALAQAGPNAASESAGTAQSASTGAAPDEAQGAAAPPASAQRGAPADPQGRTAAPASPQRCELEGGRGIHPETARRLACDASVIALSQREGRPLSVGRKTRSIPPAIRRALRARDGCCAFPGCNAKRFLDAHHVRHWAHGGQTALENLLSLCRYHHRLVHEGRFTVEMRAGGPVFRRPSGAEVPRVPDPAPPEPRIVRPEAIEIAPPERAPDGSAELLAPCSARFGGERMDLHHTMFVLLQRLRVRLEREEGGGSQDGT